MKSILFVLPALLLNSSAFAELPKDLAAIVDKLDSECSGNDNGYVGSFDASTFSASKVMRKLKADQKNDADSCRSNFSTTKAEGIAALNEVLFGRNGESDCVNSALTAGEQRKLKAMIEDPTNLGVFSKEWDGDSGDSEYCTYANYDIYRADGTLVSIVFNHTD